MAPPEVSDEFPSPDLDNSENQPSEVTIKASPEVSAPAQETIPEPTKSLADESVSPLRLIGIQGEVKDREWVFPGAFVVGIASDNGLKLTDSSVSRKHAHVWHQAGEWWVADLGSTNGTYFNGIRIGLAPVGPLQPGVLVQFGKIAVQVGDALYPATQQPARSWVELSVPSAWSAAETIQVRSPKRAGPLTFYPLFHSVASRIDYALPDEAMAGGWLSITEVSAEGQISELVVENRGNRRVLFLEGEELRGGKQNRILNTTVMVPPESAIRVPVSCVERGRWSKSARLQTNGPNMDTGSVSSSQLRHTLRTSVTRSLSGGGSHSSDQQSVWDEVRTQHATLGINSPTGSMTDTVTGCADRVAAIRESLPYAEGSSGVLVALGSRLVSLDLFDSPNTCRQVWDRLVTGLTLDGLVAGAEVGEPSLDQITTMFSEAAAAAWVPAKAVGDGAESRTEFGIMAGSALIVDSVLVHGSLVGKWKIA